MAGQRLSVGGMEWVCCPAKLHIAHTFPPLAGTRRGIPSHTFVSLELPKYLYHLNHSYIVELGWNGFVALLLNIARRCPYTFPPFNYTFHFLYFCISKQTFTFLISTSFYDHASLFWKGFYNSSVLCEENSKALLRSLHFLIWEAKITKIRAHKYCAQILFFWVVPH